MTMFAGVLPPGVSATMNLRRFGGEEPVGDVDGDALLARGGEPVDGEQRSRGRRPGAHPARVGLEGGQVVVKDQM
nr:hypothetical protein [Candidatus Microthrix sp.]